jgi:ubiquinone/menaquinone biosynthesis C-methylase UbiE
VHTERTESITFDRAVEYYDRTRGLSPEAMARTVQVLKDAIGECDVCLEVGIGTGRIALPLTEAGIQMMGVDLSRPMLRRLLDKAGDTPPPITVADAVALPFPDHRFGAALTSHVLHLIPRWIDALKEMVRVTHARSVVLVEIGDWGTGAVKDIQQQWCREAGIPMTHPGANDIHEVDKAMAELGRSGRSLETITDAKSFTPAEVIDNLERGVHSYTWRVAKETRRRASTRVRAWAEERYGSLEEPMMMEAQIEWRSYELPRA